MFANPSRASMIPHSPEELLREQQACSAPIFQGVLGNANVEGKIDDAMTMAMATPNDGDDGDIPEYGSEQGFLARKLPVIGTTTGSFIPSRHERAMDFPLRRAPFQQLYPAKPEDLIAIHVHQSPRRAPGLSAQDIASTITSPADGPAINMVAIDRNGRRYCKVAQK
jgi:hypothetical protein